MIIDNVDALKSWLAKLLEPICDADPSAFANYVVALVKKNKPEKELRALCAYKLDYFLQKETTGFVDKLFECLTTKNYLGTPAVKEESKIPVQKLEEKEEIVHVEEDRENRRQKSPSRNRSDFNESRVRDDRRRDDHKCREVERHVKSRESYRDRHKRRGGSSRGRSYSRSRSRSRRSRSRWSRSRRSHRRSSSHGKSREREHNQKREKGFCIRGDLCPLIADDIKRPTMIPFSTPSGLPRMPMPPVTKTPPGMPMPLPLHGQPPPPGVYPIPDNYDPEAYNPEFPGLIGPARALYRHFIPCIQTQRLNLIGLTSSDRQNSRAANIVIKREPSVTSVSSSKVSSNFNNQHKRTFPKKIRDLTINKLEVRKIPCELNNITKLNEHFSKFGTIINIQVVFGGDPEAALIQYTANDEAQRAISSTEAVLNNRFIRVYWHREATSNTQEQGPSQSTNPEQPHPTTNKVINKPHPAGSYVKNETPKHQPATGQAGTSEPTSPSQEPSVLLIMRNKLKEGLEDNDSMLSDEKVKMVQLINRLLKLQEKMVCMLTQQNQLSRDLEELWSEYQRKETLYRELSLWKNLTAE